MTENQQIPRHKFLQELHNYNTICQMVDVEMSALDNFRRSFEPFVNLIPNSWDRSTATPRANMEKIGQPPSIERMLKLWDDKRTSLMQMHDLYQKLEDIEKKAFSMPELPERPLR